MLEHWENEPTLPTHAPMHLFVFNYENEKSKGFCGLTLNSQRIIN
jgi:hypothetical protein